MTYCGCLLMSTIHLSQFSVRERDSRPKSQEIGVRDTWWLLLGSSLLGRDWAVSLPFYESTTSSELRSWNLNVFQRHRCGGSGLIESGETINIQTTVKYLNSTLQLEWINKNVTEYLLPKMQGKGHRHQTMYLKMAHWCILWYVLFCH